MPFTARSSSPSSFLPSGSLLERGIGSDFCINILLTILGYIPGIIHALYIILKF
ncbi:plasma membrane proteolipid Pmp3 [Xanthoria parietina]